MEMALPLGGDPPIKIGWRHWGGLASRQQKGAARIPCQTTVAHPICRLCKTTVENNHPRTAGLTSLPDHLIAQRPNSFDLELDLLALLGFLAAHGSQRRYEVILAGQLPQGTGCRESQS
jgi:hypothetical protein